MTETKDIFVNVAPLVLHDRAGNRRGRPPCVGVLCQPVGAAQEAVPGALRVNTVARVDPERVIESAVKGMLPKNKLGRAMYKKLHVYAGPEHPHAAQQPAALDL